MSAPSCEDQPHDYGPQDVTRRGGTLVSKRTCKVCQTTRSVARDMTTLVVLSTTFEYPPHR